MLFRSAVGLVILLFLSLGVSNLPGSHLETSQLSRDEQWAADLNQLYQFLQERHPNAFYVTPQEEFDAAVADLHQLIPELSDDNLILEFQRIVALVRDAHSQIQLIPGPTGFRLFPVRLYLFSDGLYVIDALEPYTEAIGARVVGVEDASAEEIIDALAPYISAENEIWLKLIAPLRFRTPEILHALGFAASADQSEWHFADQSGQTFSLTLKAVETNDVPGSFRAPPPLIDRSSEAPLYLANHAENFWMEFLEEENSIYVQYNSVQFQTQSGDTMATFTQSIRNIIAAQEIDKVIVDLRHNGGGNNGTYQHLLILLTRDPRINEQGKLYVLIGRNTFSAAVNFTAEVEYQSEAIFAGEPTGNRPHLYGDCQVSTLTHSRLPVCISTIYWTRGTPNDERLTIPPDIAVELSSGEYFARRDPVLEAVLGGE